ncbi:MAG: hypothetical protein ACREGH_00320 [Minisyncoccia bacterium]
METDIERKVMASVGAIYVARRLTSRAAVRGYVLVASLGVIASVVSVPNVLHNLFSVGVAGLPIFALTAVEHTTLLVQCGLVAILLAAASFSIDLARRAPLFGRFVA